MQVALNAEILGHAANVVTVKAPLIKKPKPGLRQMTTYNPIFNFVPSDTEQFGNLTCRIDLFHVEPPFLYLCSNFRFLFVGATRFVALAIIG